MTRFFNTLSGKVEDFKPLRDGEVGMYTCGPTVYDYAHIGNFRAFIFEDLLRRFLETVGFRVRHVMNLTDVDDKTIAGAAREGKDLEEFTNHYTEAFRQDLRTLNILPPNHPKEQPRATLEIPAMLDLIGTLVKNKIAYEKDGSVYYRISRFPGYGKLSKKKLEENITGTRVDLDEYEKEQASDFALWKKSKEGEPAWDSPWGKGRPGWHIECSAMSMKYLGQTFDIHAGGEDLIFPHHENEIAQSEAASGKPFVRYWLHCKFLLVNGEKMAKSKNNFYTLRDLLEKGHDPMAIRYELISTHYRMPLNFTLEGLSEASEIIKKLDDCYFQCLSIFNYMRKSKTHEKIKDAKAAANRLKQLWQNMIDSLSDDLNVSKALAALFEAVTEINAAMAGKRLSQEDAETVLMFFKNVDRLFGFDIASDADIPDVIFSDLTSRNTIRQDAEFKKNRDLQQRSDRLREAIHEKGWLIKDGRPGEVSTLKRKKRAWD